MELHVLLRVLILHFLSNAVLFTKMFPDLHPGPSISVRWTLLSSGVYAVLLFTGFAVWHAFWLVPVFFLVHAAAGFAALPIQSRWLRLLAYQACLLSAIILLWMHGAGTIPALLNVFLSFMESERLLLVLLGFFVLIWPTGYVIGILTEPFRRQLHDDELSEGLARAGIWIGCIERIIIYLFVLSNFVTAIAFLVTAKSIFRFGEVGKPGKRKEAEYILIGTLMSFAAAMAVGYIVRYFTGAMH
jgi:hypothetical protein